MPLLSKASLRYSLQVVVVPVQPHSATTSPDGIW